MNATILFAWLPLNWLQLKPRSFHLCHPYAAAASSNVCLLSHRPPSVVRFHLPLKRARITVRLMDHHPSLRCRYTVNANYYSALYGRRLRSASIDMGTRFGGCICRRFISLLAVTCIGELHDPKPHGGKWSTEAEFTSQSG